MKYCPACHKWNSGQPMRCRRCNRSYDYALCHRGHVNPHDAAYCGHCGSTQLSEPAGRTPIWAKAIEHYKLMLFLVGGSLGILVIKEIVFGGAGGYLLRFFLPVILFIWAAWYFTKRFLGFDVWKLLRTIARKIIEKVRE